MWIAGSGWLLWTDLWDPCNRAAWPDSRVEIIRRLGTDALDFFFACRFNEHPGSVLSPVWRMRMTAVFWILLPPAGLLVIGLVGFRTARIFQRRKSDSTADDAAPPIAS
jgi:hypothetical protein